MINEDNFKILKDLIEVIKDLTGALKEYNSNNKLPFKNGDILFDEEKRRIKVQGVNFFKKIVIISKPWEFGASLETITKCCEKHIFVTFEEILECFRNKKLFNETQKGN